MCAFSTGLFGTPGSHGGLIQEAHKMRVWSKGHPVPNEEPDEVRMDDFYSIMHYADYGDRSSPHGWEIDHITPKALGGSDDYDNLRPLHYRNNASLGGKLATILGGR